ncbi:MAG: non-ribosomal peptide synthetase, partial [Ilumatobacteraceae bacterium]
GERVLVVTMHHIAVDGWSVRRLVGELAELYAARVQDRPAVLAELPVQYLDFTVWQRGFESTASFPEQLSYWIDQLGGALPVLDLPLDRPRPPVPSYRSGTVSTELPSELLDAVRHAARAAGVTQFVFLLTGYAATLARWSGQDDFVVGTASANRSRPELDAVVGMFVDTLALRLRVEAGVPFSALLGEVRASVLGAFANHDVPFNRIVEAVNPPRDLSRPIMFQTMFVLNNMPMPNGLAIPGVTAEAVPMSAGSTEYDLSVSVVEHADRADVRVEFNADVFDRATVERFVDHWLRLLASAVADPASPAGALTMIAPAERELVLQEWAGRSTSDVPQVPMRLDQLVTMQAAASPGATALVCGAESVTYAELVDRSQRLARILIEAGVAPGDRVGVAVDRSVSMVVSLLAVLHTGAAYVPLDPAFPADRLEFMLHDADLGVVLVSSDAIVGLVEASGAVAIELSAIWDAVPVRDAGAASIEASGEPGGGVAYVIYTSGSTGRPKGVEIEHASVVNFVRSMIDEPGFGPEDVLLAVTTLSFDISVLELFVPLAVGGTVVIASRDEAVDGRRLAALIESSGTTVMQATPTTWSMLFESGWVGSPRLKVLCGGEAMPAQLGQELLHRCGEVWNMFGPTETTIWSTLQQLDATDVARVNVPIGRPISNTICRVLDTAGELVAIGVPGELFIGGAGVARGYLNRSELTAERFVPDPFGDGRLYRTGDLARWLPDGRIEYLGRLDLQVKVRGYRIELGEVESALRGEPAVSDAVVIADGEAAASRLLAYVIRADPTTPLAEGELRKALERRLPDYMIPSRFVTVDSFPLTPNRKIDRKALPRPDSIASPAAEHVAPRTDVERVVAEIVATTLRLSEVGVNDNFFELGGHSLHATSVLAKIETTFGRAIELRSFFTEPTVAATAAALTADPSTRTRVLRVAQLRVQLDAMSPEEVAAMLAARRVVGERER